MQSMCPEPAAAQRWGIRFALGGGVVLFDVKGAGNPPCRGRSAQFIARAWASAHPIYKRLDRHFQFLGRPGPENVKPLDAPAVGAVVLPYGHAVKPEVVGTDAAHLEREAQPVVILA